MKVIHVARKPIAGTVVGNALQYGTGGLNIDAGRLYCGTEHMRGLVKGMTLGGMTAGDDRQGKSLGRFEPGRAFQATDHPGGRWPANIILVHDHGCRLIGTKRVAATSVDSEAGGHQTIGRQQPPVAGYGGEDGMETVDDWVCVDGCPVMDLDDAARFFKQVGGVEGA